MYVCHRCDVSICVNPDHLFLGTSSDNRQDCIRKDRTNLYGENNGSAKLTAEDVLEARRLYADGAMLTKISKRNGVHHKTMKAAIIGKTWSRITKGAG